MWSEDMCIQVWVMDSRLPELFLFVRGWAEKQSEVLCWL